MQQALESKIVSLQQIEYPSNFLIFVQGSWEVGDNERNVAASKRIKEKGLASTLLYESSRDWSALQRASTRDEWISAFRDKNYQDELAELNALLRYINAQYLPKEIFLSGSSFGGGLVALALDCAPNISKVFLSCPQIHLDDSVERVSIYRDFPDTKNFLEAISRFHGRLHIIHGNEDNIVPLEQSFALYNAATTPYKRLVVLPGNHSFSGMNKENYVQEHLVAFR